MLEEQDLMERVARGDASAFSTLYDRLAPTVLGICLRVLRDRAEAEEVLGDVFLDLWRRADRYDPARGGVGAYLVTQARTRAIDRLRSRARRQARETEVPEACPAAGPDPLEKTVAGETRRHVLDAMGELSEVQRRALELAYFEGMTHTEVAAALGEPLGTIKTRIRQGMLHLKERLQAAYEQGAIP
ncbi:MAG TPA: sigma-70 family RNA polymerase sigma factor [Candidatus Polarisedimenticolaceae bacterium]|nr:sigma-70 family RNA polymerase sigma factor [Candidatus Polarisedimenticolaceae bacterium]